MDTVVKITQYVYANAKTDDQLMELLKEIEKKMSLVFFARGHSLSHG